MKYSLTGLALSAGAFASSLPVHIETREPLTSHLANIHVRFAEPTSESLTFTYGSCTASSPSDSHHTIATTDSVRVSRLAWAIPDGTHDKGCISAWKRDGTLVGRSETQKLHRVKRRAPQRRGEGELSSSHSMHNH